MKPLLRAEICRSDTRWPRRRPQRYWWRITSPNGRILAVSSEMYTNRGDAARALTVVTTSAFDLAADVVQVPRRR